MKVILLCAGKSSRMWPLAQHKNKCMYEFLGKPLLYHTLIDLKRSGFSDIVLITSPNDGSIRDYFNDGKDIGMRIAYAVQPEPRGTGDALLCASQQLHETFILANATKANVSMVIGPMLPLARTHSSDIVLAGRLTETPWKYGILKAEGDRVVGVVEKPARGTECGNTKIEGVYILTMRFMEMLRKAPCTENMLEETLQRCIDSGLSVRYAQLPDIPEITLKHPWDVFAVNKILLDAEPSSRISPLARVHPTVIIEGKVIIDENAVVHEHATVKGPCYIGADSVVGNNAMVREYSSLGTGCVAGFCTDVKHSILFGDARADMCYIGDSILDEGVRFGAGTITANRRLDRGTIRTPVQGQIVDSGLTFFGSVVGKDTKTGIHTSLMPGTKIGVNCVVWPGTVVGKDVPDNSEVVPAEQSVTKPR